MGVLCLCRGSVIPKAMFWSAPAAIVSVLLHIFWETPKGDSSLEVQGIESIWGGFTFVLGFLIVFRSNQAYNRFWESVTLLYQTTGEWTSAYSNLLAFCSEEDNKQQEVWDLVGKELFETFLDSKPFRDSLCFVHCCIAAWCGSEKCSVCQGQVLKWLLFWWCTQVRDFQALLSKLMSLLYCSALQDMCELEDDTLEVLDLGGFSRRSLQHLRDSPDRAESVLLWIERLIVHADKRKIIDAPAPIISRAFQELSRGMVTVNNMRKIHIPFPFPYSQHLACVLIIYTVLTPIVASQSILQPWWAGIMVFVVCVSYWTLFYIAQEIDQPFGDDPNDLPIKEMQHDFNSKLSFFSQPLSYNVPEFRPDASQHIHMLGSNFSLTLDFKNSASRDSQTFVLPPVSAPDETGIQQMPALPTANPLSVEEVGSLRDSSQVVWEPLEDPLNSAVLQELLPKVLPEDFAIADIRRILEAAGIDADRASASRKPRANTAASASLSMESRNLYTASLTALSLRVEDLLSQRESALTEPALRQKMYKLKEALAEVLMDQCRV